MKKTYYTAYAIYNCTLWDGTVEQRKLPVYDKCDKKHKRFKTYREAAEAAKKRKFKTQTDSWLVLQNT